MGALLRRPLYPFNDFHAAMAHLGAGRHDRVDALLDRMAAAGGTETAAWIAQQGRPLIEGLTAFRRGAWREAADRLWSARHIAGAFGGSHAQRDVIDWTLTEAALHAAASPTWRGASWTNASRCARTAR
jgi:hypothetical protein